MYSRYMLSIKNVFPRGTIKNMSTLSYDSQSGMTYEIISAVRTHLIVRNDQDHDRIKSLTGQAPVGDMNPIYCTDSTGHGDVLANIQKSGKSRCTIMDSFSCDVAQLQVLTAKLADCGCKEIFLTDTDMYEKEVEDIEEAIDAVLYSDVVGMPMAMRVGIRVCGERTIATPGIGRPFPYSAQSRAQVKTALAMGLWHFDVSVNGFDSILWSHFNEITKEMGIKIEKPVHVDIIKTIESEFCR